MSQRSSFNQRSNDELARLLYQNGSKKDAAEPRVLPPAPAPPPDEPEPLASRRVSELGPQNWTLNERRLELGPLTPREERALFAALSKGMRANLGREPTVPELMQLLRRVNEARAFVAVVEQALRSNDGIYLEDGRIVFAGSAQRRLARRESAGAA